MQKRGQKVKLRNGLLLYFWFHIARFVKETLRLRPAVWFLSFFTLKFFDFFYLNWIFSLNSAIMESNTSLLNAFLAPLSIKFPQNCLLNQLQSHKRNLFQENSTCEMSALSPFLSVLFDLISSLSFIYFQIYRCSL